jgi:hypothetical protein
MFMDVTNFLKTIYLGDRFCTKMVLDGLNNQFELHINQISRIRDVSGEWNFYTDEDIKNGIIVIAGVKKIIFDESGLLPNDQVYDIYANKIDDTTYQFIIETSHIDEKTQTHDLIIKVLGEGGYLIDPTRSDIKITK